MMSKRTFTFCCAIPVIFLLVLVLPEGKSLPHLKQTPQHDVYFAIKTTGKFHRTRLRLLLETWVPSASSSAYIFSDEPLPASLHPGAAHFINTGCHSGHSRSALCCKFATELEWFLNSTNHPWFCHFDDDSYVHVPNLRRLLSTFDSSKLWYIGKPSLDKALDITRIVKGGVFWFATGGAGVCMSRPLVLKMRSWTTRTNFMRACDQISLPDDCTLGYLAHLVRANLTQVSSFHSHLEDLSTIDERDLEHQVTLSYNADNTISITGLPKDKDPSRLYSFHCKHFPDSSRCKELM